MRRTEAEARKCSQENCPGDGRYQPPGKGHLPGCSHDAVTWVWEDVAADPTTDPAALSPANETPKACDCECNCVGVKHHWASCANRPAPVQPPAPDPDETWCEACKNGHTCNVTIRGNVYCQTAMGGTYAPAPVSPATTGGTDEALAQIIRRAYMAACENRGERTTWDLTAAAVLASDWLAARDARTRADTLLAAMHDLLLVEDIDTEVALTGVDYVAMWLRDRAEQNGGQA